MDAYKKSSVSVRMFWEESFEENLWGYENWFWRQRYVLELYKLFQGQDIVKTERVKWVEWVLWVRWVGSVVRMHEGNSTRKILLGSPFCQLRQRRPRQRFLNNIKQDIQSTGVIGWWWWAADGGYGPPSAVTPWWWWWLLLLLLSGALYITYCNVLFL